MIEFFFSSFLETVPRALTTNCIIATSCSFSKFLAKFRYLSGFLLLSLSLWSTGMAKSKYKIFFFLLIKTKFDLLSWIGCTSKYQRILCFIFKDSFWFVHIPFVRVKFYFLAQFPVDHLPHPVVSVLVLVCCIHLLPDYRIYLSYEWPLIFSHKNMFLSLHIMNDPLNFGYTSLVKYSINIQWN